YETVKKLCEEWFPVEYPAKWFEAITSDTNLFSLAAVLDGTIVGLIVAELKQGKDLNREDRDILCDSQLRYTAGVYSKSWNAKALDRYFCPVYLTIYQHYSAKPCFFMVHKFLPYYYSIGGRARDGFTYVLYLNGGHGPWGFHEYVQHFCESSVWISTFKGLLRSIG
ncbi:N-alpha-acetyltransferase 60, partial [Orchesella cincta]